MILRTGAKYVSSVGSDGGQVPGMRQGRGDITEKKEVMSQEAAGQLQK